MNAMKVQKAVAVASVNTQDTRPESKENEAKTGEKPIGRPVSTRLLVRELLSRATPSSHWGLNE